MTDPLASLRRQAKELRRAYDWGDAAARSRVAAQMRQPPEPLRHADALHVLAREAGYPSWPAMKFTVETEGMDRAALQQRLKIALAQGQTWVVQRLLQDTPDLARGLFGLEVALYDRPAVEAALAENPDRAVALAGPVRPILHLARSRMHQVWPEKVPDMIAIAQMLVTHGADVNDAIPHEDGPLSALYLALGHADNLTLARWLLEQGADPNDGESLYHATELPHADGVRLLLDHGARPAGTNALLRAIDKDDEDKIALLLAAGADPNERAAGGPGIPVLHHLARRGASEPVCRALLEAGADTWQRYQGASAYAFARVYGNRALAALLEAAGVDQSLTKEEALLAAAAEGVPPPGQYIDPAKLSGAYADLLVEIVPLEGRSGHVKALVGIGMDYDRPDTNGLSPVQIAGWEGLPDMLAYFIDLRPDLSRVNGFGGTLLTTILHGSENHPAKETRDHLECLRIVLDHGLALPRKAVDFAGEPEVAAFLSDWARAHPGQVVDA
ncbi:ankyrin repeat domain-containing protein [Flavimaricola marinus]|uniref:Ankyrin repeats (3 copies) n=1 Tax=Flavimaricola marinus TaxID=1819565 RepID=A0A238LCS6_9RHOB|nr:ankyrin repeat domain-containing protein [Flavimaricola marinus]SMY06746.1 Ankyrin repeats (3 copies) [Flavimaricola marinus]